MIKLADTLYLKYRQLNQQRGVAGMYALSPVSDIRRKNLRPFNFTV
jgi:hypothetical protein